MEPCPDEPSVTNEETTSAGELLRRCREAGGHTLEEIAEATKISKTYLRALEENRFQDLPSPAYLRGFLKLYAEYLGINTADLLARIDEGPGAAVEAADTVQAERSGRPWMERAQRFALPLALLAALLLSTLFMQPAGRDTAQPKPEVPPPQPAVQASVSGAAVPPASAAAGETSADPAAEEAAVPQPQLQSGFVVRMKVLKNGTLTVTIDETMSQNYQVTAGDLIEWKAVENLALDISDAAAVELELNGKPLKYPAVPGKSAHLILGPEGVRL